VLTAGVAHMTVFWVLTLCNTSMFQCFNEMCCLHQAAHCSRTFQQTFATLLHAARTWMPSFGNDYQKIWDNNM